MLFTFLSLPQRAAELAAVEGYAVFVQDTEDGTAAVEAAHRPDFIADDLLNRGIPSERITKHSFGGINTYTPAPANRYARLKLHF